jgi:activator of HSP90 ATPase
LRENARYRSTGAWFSGGASTGRIIQQIELPASPHDIYEALMDTDKHAEFTGLPADISREEGGEFMAGDGYIQGRNLELVPDSSIVQLWRGSDFPEGYYSTLTFELLGTSAGTLLRMTHDKIPEDLLEGVDKGWHDHYWEPLRKWLESR